MESMRKKIIHLEKFKSSETLVQTTLPCLIVNLSRSQTQIKTHCSDLLELCTELKNKIIEGIREDFREINHNMGDNYDKSMIIRENLNRKDKIIKRIDELIKLLTSFHELMFSFTTLSEAELQSRLSTWNEDYHKHQVTYKDILGEYESMYGVKGASSEVETFENTNEIMKSEYIDPPKEVIVEVVNPQPMIKTESISLVETDRLVDDLTLEPETLKCWPNRLPLKLEYTGRIVNGKKTGLGKLRWASTKDIFYEGQFLDDKIYGKNFKLFSESDPKQPLLVIENMKSDSTLDSATGTLKLYHENGNIAYDGHIVDGLKDGENYQISTCFCKEF